MESQADGEVKTCTSTQDQGNARMNSKESHREYIIEEEALIPMEEGGTTSSTARSIEKGKSKAKPKSSSKGKGKGKSKGKGKGKGKA